jgi:hypothetical protein
VFGAESSAPKALNIQLYRVPGDPEGSASQGSKVATSM